MGQYVPQIEALAKPQLRVLAPFAVGDTVKVHYRITEGDKERVQIFQGTVIRNSGSGLGKTFCVRKRSAGVGVERIFASHSPRIELIEVVSHGHVRRARLYYLRELQGKAARLRTTREPRGAKVSANAEAKAEAHAETNAEPDSDAATE